MNEKREAEDFTPDPISLLESNRNLGYSIEEAISDLIDNSLSAKATEIRYEMHWNNGLPYFLLKDNGHGISVETNELVNSFKLGSTNPLEERAPDDLGRFGFGMKTASLSQARTLIVITKKANEETDARALDLDFIKRSGNWKLRYCDKKEVDEGNIFLSDIVSGTVIKWKDWDRAPKKRDDFESMVIYINDYLSLCFHRFIENGVSIYCHDTRLNPCSPIPDGEGASQYSKITLKNSAAKQTAYILQHPRHWSEDYENSRMFNSFKLFEGFERQQGIYIYRCDRLLTPKGGWLGLINKGNAAKLARVVIDYPNNDDHNWSLDITKTNAIIPFEFKSEIKKLITVAKNASIVKIIKGTRTISDHIDLGRSSFIWKSKNDNYHKAHKYYLDIDHPIFKQFVENNKIDRKDLSEVFNLISDNLPVAKIIENNDKDPSKHDRMIKNEKLSDFEIFHAKNLFNQRLGISSKSEAFSYLLSHEPFCYYEEQLNSLLNE